MISKCMVFLFAALMLANCCSVGTDCAPASGAPLAWDGLGSAPAENTKGSVPSENTEPVELSPPRKQARAKREIILGPLDGAAADPAGKVRSKDRLDKAQAADQDEENRLKRTLRICSAC